MEGNLQGGAAANGLGGEDYILVKAGKEDVAVAADGGDHGDLADGDALVGSLAAVTAPDEPAKAPTKVRGSPNSGSRFAPCHVLVRAHTLLLAG